MISLSKDTHHFQTLVEVVAALRGPEGCPWDKQQTHQSLTQYAIEEAHELADAIDNGQQSNIIEELGDLLLQVVLHAEIARQAGAFSLPDIIRTITEKMIRRHPHVFSNVKVKNSAEVLHNWARIKEAEKEAEKQSAKKSEKEATSNPFASVPRALPALIRAQKIGSKTVRFHFDWSNPWQVIEKIEEELSEVKEALRDNDPRQQQKELGDLLFTVVQLARHLNFDAEQSLRMANNKFEKRFIKMHQCVAQDKKIFAELTATELEYYWQKAKVELQDR